MKRKLLVLWFFLMICGSRTASAYTDHDYPYETTSGCVETCTIDDLGFCQNNCTSYAAYVLKKVYGIDFSNSYGKVHWGHGGNWNDAAGKVKLKNDDGQMFDDEIIVDDNPIPGDVAYWEKDWTDDPKNHGDDYGHVAVVERVHFDDNGNVTGIDVSEYNYSPSCRLSDRSRDEQRISTEDSGYPTGFIHILAHNEGVTGLYYLDCYEMDTLCDFQTKKEWTWILEKIAGYRCQNCEGRYMAEADSFYDDFGMGGGGGDDERKPLPNLQIQKFQVFNRNKLLTEEKSFLEPEKTYQIHLWPVSKKENCRNGIEKGKNTVETNTFYKVALDENQGEWKFLGRSYTKCANLTKDNSKKETFSFTVPEEAIGKRIYFKSKVDSTGEVTETDEHDNWSDKEWYPVLGNCDLTVSYARLTQGRTVLQEGESFGVEMAVLNQGPDFCPMDIRSAYLHRSPNSSVWEVIASDDTKAVHLAPGQEHPELTKDEPFTVAIAGFHDAMVCADNLETQPETNEENNCFQFSFEVTEKKETSLPDYTVLNAALTGNRTLLSLGDHFGIWMTVANIGNAPAPKDSIGGYYVMYPNTENWVYLADDTTNKDQLCVNCSHLEITQDDPFKADQLGIWKALACSSYKYKEKELDYANNCKEMIFEVTAGQVKLPDYVAADASLTGRKTVLKLGEHFGIRGVSKNIGNADSQEDTRLGYYTMRPGSGEWKLQDSDKVSAEQMCVNCLKEEWTKEEPFIADAIGVWQVLVCASYQYQARELDYNDNCFPWFSFEVKPDYGFEWSFAGTIHGKTCVNFWEGADPYTWGDNYLCSKDNLGIQWSPAGPINTMRCTQINESANPPEHTWADNFICVPQDSPIFFSWSSNGKIDGLECLKINEPAEPPNHTWEDNWLCY